MLCKVNEKLKLLLLTKIKHLIHCNYNLTFVLINYYIIIMGSTSTEGGHSTKLHYELLNVDFLRHASFP